MGRCSGTPGLQQSQSKSGPTVDGWINKTTHGQNTHLFSIDTRRGHIYIYIYIYINNMEKYIYIYGKNILIATHIYGLSGRFLFDPIATSAPNSSRCRPILTSCTALFESLRHHQLLSSEMRLGGCKKSKT